MNSAFNESEREAYSHKESAVVENRVPQCAAVDHIRPQRLVSRNSCFSFVLSKEIGPEIHMQSAQILHH